MSNAGDGVRFSVVIPALNEADYISAALISLAQQDFAGRYEVIVVDNNSTDATADVARSHGATVVYEQVPGVCAARQRGMLASQGQIVVSTDADTVHPRDWLTRIDARFRRSEGVVAVAGPCRYQNPSWWARLYPRLLFGTVRGVYSLTGQVLYLSATNVAFDRSAFSGYDTKLTQGGDELDLLRRLRKRGRVIWLGDNVVDTSPRRLEQGLFYTFFVSLLAHYFLAYFVNRMTSRTLLGMAPAFRQGSAALRSAGSVSRRRRAGALWLALSFALLVSAAVAFLTYDVADALHDLAHLLVTRR